MRRSVYAVLAIVSDLTSLIAFLWLFAKRVSVGVAARLPENRRVVHRGRVRNRAGRRVAARREAAQKCTTRS